MDDPAKRFDKVKAAFTLSPDQISQIATKFQAAMRDGLAGRPSSLKMLPSFLAKPSGSEQGRFLALDFGGTNVRAQLIELGGGRWTVLGKRALPLKDPAGRYDYTAAETAAAELFNFLADQIAAVASDASDYSLGHTFSFPCRQQGLNRAVLINWTKEIKTAGVEGREITALLTEALLRKGLVRVKPRAIINDTVGTLLTAAYGDPNTDIGSICGTGHNTCYFESATDMIVNMESGNFADLPFTEYDQYLDAASERPGSQRLEKMVAGRYLGELVRLIIVDCLGLSLDSDVLTAEDLAGILSGLPGIVQFAALTVDELQLVQAVAEAVTARSAQLVAATFLGVLARIDPALQSQHTIAVDGSLYEKMPGYAPMIKAMLTKALGDKAGRLTTKLSKDGSGIGAAIAAAVAGSAAG